MLYFHLYSVQDFFFFFGLTARRILVPRPGVELVPPAVKAWSPDHWISREVPSRLFLLLAQLLLSVAGIQDFRKTMPFILMRVRWPADEVTIIRFSLTS